MQQWNKKHRSIRHYDQQAEIYDVQYLEEQNAKIKEILTNMKFGSNELVLDLGCGTGFLFKYLKNRVGLLVGVDISQKALLQAKKRTKEISNIVLIRADADQTPFVAQLFDKVFVITLLQNMPDPSKTIEEIKRISKPQAMIAITGLKKKFKPKTFFELLKRAQLKVVIQKTNEKLKGIVTLCKTVDP